MSHHAKAVASSATTKPQCRRKPSPNIRGNMAVAGSDSEIGFVLPGARSTGVLSR